MPHVPLQVLPLVWQKEEQWNGRRSVDRSSSKLESATGNSGKRASKGDAGKSKQSRRWNVWRFRLMILLYCEPIAIWEQVFTIHCRYRRQGFNDPVPTKKA